MRHDPIELGLPSAAAARREPSRRQPPHHVENTIESLRGAHALRAIDEAFATLAENIERVQRMQLGGTPDMTADAGIPRTSQNEMEITPAIGRRPMAESGASGARQLGHERVLANLAEQLTELDRQREQLAQLLHQVSVIGSAD